MSPWLIACWLLLAAALSALAAVTRPTLLGAPAAVVVSAVPEIIGRHDFGAMAEPGAMAGALVQWLLIALVVALALVAQRQLAARRPIPVAIAIRWPAPAPSVTTPRSLLYARGIRSRAPPRWSSNP